MKTRWLAIALFILTQFSCWASDEVPFLADRVSQLSMALAIKNPSCSTIYYLPRVYSINPALSSILETTDQNNELR
jgi:hypothetical protein